MQLLPSRGPWPTWGCGADYSYNKYHWPLLSQKSGVLLGIGDLKVTYKGPLSAPSQLPTVVIGVMGRTLVPRSGSNSHEILGRYFCHHHQFHCIPSLLHVIASSTSCNTKPSHAFLYISPRILSSSDPDRPCTADSERLKQRPLRSYHCSL